MANRQKKRPSQRDCLATERCKGHSQGATYFVSSLLRYRISQILIFVNIAIDDFTNGYNAVIVGDARLMGLFFVEYDERTGFFLC